MSRKCSENVQKISEAENFRKFSKKNYVQKISEKDQKISCTQIHE